MKQDNTTFKFEGSALTIFDDFIKYATLYPKEMADVMHYDYDAFKSRIARLKRQYEDQI